MNEEMDRTWQALSEEVLTGLKEWRLAHPKATLREIEQAVEERVNRLKARMLQDVALASAASDWTQDPEAQRPVCPGCGTPLQARGTHTRKLHAPGGQDITLAHVWNLPDLWGRAFPPQIEELALTAGNLVPSLQEHMTHLARWMPFGRAAQMLERVLGVHVSAATIRRHTEAAGALYEQEQTVTSQQAASGNAWSAPASAVPQRLVRSRDGAFVGLVKGAWAEVRTLVIGAVDGSRFLPARGADPHPFLLLAHDRCRHVRRTGGGGDESDEGSCRQSRSVLSPMALNGS